MNDPKPNRLASDNDVVPGGSTSPLVFISHDTRDADLAEAFSKLLKSVSAGMIKTFRSSDKKAGEGIDFGDEWYKRLMERLQSTSDVVCLFTDRSLDRPWLLFEAGVAKGKLNTPVVGIALGVQLSRVSAGPFYQFQNMDDSETDLVKLVHQLARRIPGLELDADVVRDQVQAFKVSEAAILKSLSPSGKNKNDSGDADDSPFAKLIEEMKTLPSRVVERLSENGEPVRPRRMRRFHPMMLEQLLNISGERGDSVGILMAASVIRDDMPWLYELAMETYRAVNSGDIITIDAELNRVRRFSEVVMQMPFIEEFSSGSKESYMFAREFPTMLEHTLRRALSSKERVISVLRSKVIPKATPKNEPPQ